MTSKKATKKQAPTAAELAELEKLANFGPALDDATMYELEKVAGGRDIGIQRRIALAVLTKSAEELSKVSAESQETYAEMRRAIEGFREHVEGLHGAATAAALRIVVADIGEPAKAAQ